MKLSLLPKVIAFKQITFSLPDIPNERKNDARHDNDIRTALQRRILDVYLH